MISGVHQEYQWLETNHNLREFQMLCAEVIRNKFLVITAVDSGSFSPSPEDQRNGWEEAGGIAYSLLVESLDDLPANCCCRDCYGFDEWYVFGNRPQPLGPLAHGNVFETEMKPGTVIQFINFGGFRFSDLRMEPIIDLFWKQMDWIQPEFYVGDGEQGLVFVTQDKKLFRIVQTTLENSPSKLPVIRPAVPSEQKALEALQWRASLSNPDDRDALLAHPDAIELPLEQITSGAVFVAEQEGNLTGFAVILPRADGGTELDGLFVDPTMWRHGIGRSLVQWCASVARSRGSTALYVTGNPHATSFYLACGFQQIGMTETRFGPGLLLRKNL